MANTQTNVQITSCALGGHLLGRGNAVQKAIQTEIPGAQVKNGYGCPLQFSVVVDGEPVLGGCSGMMTILGLLTCCTSPQKVAQKVVLAKKVAAPNAAEEA
jgi:hypothetical protein